MAVCVKCLLLFSSALAVLARADDRVQYNEEHEKRWNTPPELTPEQVTGKKSATINGRPEARFLPFSASITLNAGHDNSDALQLGTAGLGGISVSQSSSFSQAGANSFGNSGSLAASQSSSFTAGLTGISASNANAFSVNHPGYGGQSNANSNSFSIGQASSSAQANAQNGQANSGSQSSIGTTHFSPPSGGNVQVLSDGLTIGQHQGPRQPVWTNIGPNLEFPGRPISGRPVLTIEEAPIVNIPKRPTIVNLDSFDSRWQVGRPQLQIGQWHQNGEVDLQGHQWRPHSKHDYAQNHPSIPGSWLQGQGQSQAHTNGGLQFDVVSANSGASSNSQGHSQSQGTAISFNFNRDGRRTQDTSANDFVKFPGPSHTQSIPREFVRRKQAKNKREGSIIEGVFSDLTDTVSDLLDNA